MIEANIADVLREHATRYPKMQPRDAVKLLYQPNFGPGHLIKDAASAIRRIQEEQINADTSLSPLMEHIGHGYVRVYLHPGISADMLGETFAASAKEIHGTTASFLEDIDVLRRLTAEGVFAFSADELERCITQYKSDGMPMISHSSEYKEAYNPAYRVVLSRLANDVLANI